MATPQPTAGLLGSIFVFLLCLLAPQYLLHTTFIFALLSGASHMMHQIQSSERSELAAWTREQTHKKEFEAYRASEATKYEAFTASHRNRFEKMEDEYAGVLSVNARLASEKLELGLKLQTVNNDLASARAMGRGNTSGCTKMHYSHPAAETARKNADLENKLEYRTRELLKARAIITRRDDEIAGLHKTIQQQALNGKQAEASCTALRVAAQKQERKTVRLERLLKVATAPRPTMPSTLPRADTTTPPPEPTVPAQAAAEKDTQIAALQQQLEQAKAYRTALEKRAWDKEHARETAQRAANAFYEQLSRLGTGLKEFSAKAAYIALLSSGAAKSAEPATPTLDALSKDKNPGDALLQPLAPALALLPAAHAAARSQRFEDMVRDFSQRHESLSKPADAPPTTISPDVLTSPAGSDEDKKLTRPLLNALGDWKAAKIMNEMLVETLEIAVPGVAKYNGLAERKKAAPEWVLGRSAALRDDRLGAAEAKRRRNMVEECGRKMEFVRAILKGGGEK